MKYKFTDNVGIRRQLLPGIVLLCALGVAFAAAPFGRPGLAPDSLIYYETASHLLSGQGLSYQSETPLWQSTPLATWAPGYPFLLAAVSWLTGLSLDVSASIIILVSISAVGLLVYKLCVRRTSPEIAALMSIVLLMEHPVQLAGAYALSEGVFLPIILLVLYWTERYLEDGRARYLLFVCLFAVMGAWVRHAGSVFLAIAPVAIVLFSSDKIARRLSRAVILICAELALMLPVWVRNYELTGYLTGSNRGGVGYLARIPGDISLVWDLFIKFFFAFDTVLQAILFVPFILLLIFFIFRICGRGCLLFFDKNFLVPVFFSGCYFLFIIYARVANKYIDLPDTRMLGVMWPMLFVSIGFVVQRAFDLRDDLSIRFVVSLFLLLRIYSDSSIMYGAQSYKWDRDTTAYSLTFAFSLNSFRSGSVPSVKWMGKIGPLEGNKTLFFDAQPHVLEYLTGIRAYRWAEHTPCSVLTKLNTPGTIVVVNPQFFVHAHECAEQVPGWNVREVHGGLMF